MPTDRQYDRNAWRPSAEPVALHRSAQVLKQQVFGLEYIDELCQLALNQDPENATTGTTTENLCERFFWTLADANFNIVGVVTNAGQLVERYEYTPYGRRTVYSHGWLMCDLDGDGVLEVGNDEDDLALFGDGYGGGDPAHMGDLDGNGQVDLSDLIIMGQATDSLPAADPLVSYPRLASYRSDWTSTDLGHTPLCEFGHQGLMHDEMLGGVPQCTKYVEEN